jgi:hypothetical protein
MSGTRLGEDHLVSVMRLFSDVVTAERGEDARDIQHCRSMLQSRIEALWWVSGREPPAHPGEMMMKALGEWDLFDDEALTNFDVKDSAFYYGPSLPDLVVAEHFMVPMQEDDPWVPIINSILGLLPSDAPRIQKERIYAAARLFFTEHPILTSASLGLFRSRLINAGLSPISANARLRDIFYSAAVDPKTMRLPTFRHVCSYCGCPAVQAVGQSSPRCYGAAWHTSAVGLSEVTQPVELVLQADLLRFVVAPGSFELKIRKAAHDLNFEVEMFPGMDACDLAIETPNGKIFVDAKAETRPELLFEREDKGRGPRGLKHYRISDRLEGATPDNFYIVIPDQIWAQPHYERTLRGYLINRTGNLSNLKTSHVLSFSKFCSILKRSE